MHIWMCEAKADSTTQPSFDQGSGRRRPSLKPGGLWRGWEEWEVGWEESGSLSVEHVELFRKVVCDGQNSGCDPNLLESSNRAVQVYPIPNNIDRW